MLAFCITLLLSISTQAQGPPGGNGPPLWKLSGNSISSGDFLGTTNNMPLVLKTNSTEHLRLLPSGELGIGTSTPQHLLDVAGSFGVSDTAFLDATRISGPFYLQDGSQGSGKVLTSNGQGKGSWKPFGSLSYWTKNGGHLSYLGSGNVGIGTSAPQRTLDVAGDALVRNKLYVQNGIEVGGVIRGDTSRFGRIEPRPGDSAVYVGGETHMMTDACVMNGRFGVGTGSPGERLSVQGNARIHGKTMTDSLEVYGRTDFSYATFDSIRVGDSSIVIGSGTGNQQFPGNRIDTDEEPLTLNPTGSGEIHTGNVGVGAFSPEKKLHVKATHLSGIIVDPEPGDDPVFSDPELGDVIGDHAGIRLENETYSVGGNTLIEEVKWDIQPKISSSSQDFLAFTKPSFSNGNPLFALKDNRRAVVNGRLIVRRDAEDHLSLVDPDNGDGNGYGINFKMKDQFKGYFLDENGNKDSSTVDGGVAHVRASGDPQAMVLGIYNYWDRSIVIHRNGQVGIGTEEVIDDHQLSVKGSIISNEVVVEEAWSDHVFEKDYELPSLEEEKAHIESHGHLKDIPSEKEIKEEGLSLGDLTRMQQREIEEVYLHLFEMKETIQAQAKAIESKKKEVEQKEKEIELLRERNEMLEKELELLKEIMDKRSEKEDE